MKLILENIGKIKKAEIDLDHQLTVFFGPNNTGKTYVSYCLYGLSRFETFVDIRSDLIESIDNLLKIDFDSLRKTGIIKIDLIKIFLPIREILRSKYSESFRKLLPALFGNYEMDFSNAEVSLSVLNSDEEFEAFIKNKPAISIKDGSPPLMELRNDGNGFLFIENITGLSKFGEFDKSGIEKITKEQIVNFIFNLNIGSATFMPAERIGISVFGKDVLHRRFERSNMNLRKSESFSYSRVIEAAILEQDSLPKSKSVKSNCESIAKTIEDTILMGNLSVDAYSDIFYGDEGVKNLSIRNSASTIKSLSSLVFYLRHFAQEGATLFIDEPEINLHPENQIKIARILAKIANAGIKVYVSTHSDYIIREFNNLMMLGKEDKERERLMKEYGYKKDEVLEYKKVGAYFFNGGLAEQLEVTETGFVAESIDEAINMQNKASNDIMWTLFES